MPIKPLPYKLKCPKCGYSTVVRPKSDTDITGLIASVCPKCGNTMERVKVAMLDEVIGFFK